LRLNDEPVARGDLETALRSLYASRADHSIFLQADRSLPYAAVIDLMDACREAGVERIGVITRKSPASGGPSATHE
jgi:biopolymer transport protein ExbD